MSDALPAVTPRDSGDRPREHNQHLLSNTPKARVSGQASAAMDSSSRSRRVRGLTGSSPQPARRTRKALPLQPNGDVRNVFVRDLARGTTRRISRTNRGDPNAPSYLPAISEDGRWIAFVSNATDLVTGDENELSDVFLHDLHTSKTSLVTRSASGEPANGASSRPAISANGQYVAFESDASNLVCSRRCLARDLDINLLFDVFAFDRSSRVITPGSARIRVSPDEPSGSPAIDGPGNVIAFSSRRPTDDRDPTL